MDASFCPKSGKHTYGLDWFYNGSASRSQKGLEISLIAVVDVAEARAYTLSVQQTPAHLNRVKSKGKGNQKPPARISVSQSQIQQIRERLDSLPEAFLPVLARAEMPRVSPLAVEELTRIDHDLNHLRNTRAHLPPQLKYLAVDGFYSKQKFVDGVVSLDLGQPHKNYWVKSLMRYE